MTVGARPAAAVSTDEDTRAAAEDVAERVRADLAGAPADVAFLFLSPEHAGEAEAAAAAVMEILGPGALAGATGEAVIGTGCELEGVPAMSLLAMSLPGGRASVHHLSVRDTGDGPAVEMPAELLPAPGEPMLLIADPYSFPADAFLEGVEGRFQGAVAVGGLASGGAGPGEHAFICGRRVMRHGAIAVTVDGDVRLRVLVSQGCAAVGPEMVITSADGNIIHELAGRPAYERLTDIVAGLDDHGRDLVQRGLLAGLVIDENRAEYGSDDYLMRAVMGGDADQGSLVVGDTVRVGQTFRFHARDAESADADLRAALRRHADNGERPQAGLLFACNGRGSNMYPDPDHDAGAVVDELGPIPLAGMFCSGEIGPVGGHTFLHGFTATMALLTSRG
ncbi:MAG TPA: FIST N-terminal domain-containing protein [Gaiellales bacterium]|nr:FIST N-terminal domain-containing protein [Gaiellales bacterium]